LLSAVHNAASSSEHRFVAQPDAIGDLPGRPTNYLRLIAGRDVPTGISTPLRLPANTHVHTGVRRASTRAHQTSFRGQSAITSPGGKTNQQDSVSPASLLGSPYNHPLPPSYPNTHRTSFHSGSSTHFYPVSHRDDAQPLRHIWHMTLLIISLVTSMLRPSYARSTLHSRKWDLRVLDDQQLAGPGSGSPTNPRRPERHKHPTRHGISMHRNVSYLPSSHSPLR
jgi:hypothetical protein